MTDTAKDFERELEVFRTEAESAAQFFYSYLAIHEVAKRHKSVFRMLDANALFWNTILGGLQTATVIALGRIFDQQSPHNVDKVLGLAQRNITMFSKAALGKRKQGNLAQPPPWLSNYLSSAYEPTQTDFRRLRRHVKKYRKAYEDRYRDLRHQIYAHKQTADPTAVAALVAKTNINEMQLIFVFLLQLHQALQQLFINGSKPVLRRFRYSAQRIRRLPSAAIPSDGVHERIVKQAEQALLGISRLPRNIDRRTKKPAAVSKR